MHREPVWCAGMAVALAVLAPLVAADICSTLDAEGIEVESPLTLDYSLELQDYWSVACGDLRPSCIAYPTSALEMSQIVKELHMTEDLFAIKSGGHMPNKGFSSIQNGLLISTKRLNEVTYDSDDQTAVIGPGLQWEEAQKGLDDLNTGRTVVGGRLGGVGVGGYMLGGGLSFLSSQHGWAANNVVNYEVVIADGSIVNANENENPELFAALKGGGNNFGIVTSYTLQTYPISKVWGGNYIFTPDKTAGVLQAVRDFTEYYLDDKAAVIVTVEHGALIHTWIVFVFYDGPEPPQGVFDCFTALDPIDTTKTWDTYYDLLKNNDFFILKGQRYTIATETTPLPSKEVGEEVMQSYYDHWFNITNTVLSVPWVIGSMALQPMPRTITSKAKARGGDLLDFPTDQDYIIIELDFSYSSSANDEEIDQANKDLFGGFDTMISGYISEGILPDVYRPLFLNDAYYPQDYWGRICPASKQRALSAREKYDPEKFFQTRTSGGFRVG